MIGAVWLLWAALVGAGLALGLARLAGWPAPREVDRGRDILLRLARTGHLVVSSLEVRDLLLEVVQLLDQAYPGYAVAILVADGSGHELRVGALGRGHPPDHVAATFKVGVQGVTGRAAAERRVIRVPDIAKTPDYVRGLESGGSELAVPIVFHDRLLGVLDLESPRRDDFDADDVAAATAIADQIAAALENARLYALLRQAVDAMSAAEDQLGDRSRRAGAGEMATRTAHALGGPLTAVIAGLTRIRDEVPPGAARDQVADALDQAHEAVERLRALGETVRLAPRRRSTKPAGSDLGSLGVELVAEEDAERARSDRLEAGRHARAAMAEGVQERPRRKAPSKPPTP